MNVVNQSLNDLELLAAERPPDVPKIQALIGTIREEFRRLNSSQQVLIESNAALVKHCGELEVRLRGGER